MRGCSELPCGGWVGIPDHICRFHLLEGSSSPDLNWRAPSHWDCTQKKQTYKSYSQHTIQDVGSESWRKSFKLFAFKVFYKTWLNEKKESTKRMTTHINTLLCYISIFGYEILNRAIRQTSWVVFVFSKPFIRNVKTHDRIYACA